MLAKKSLREIPHPAWLELWGYGQAEQTIAWAIDEGSYQSTEHKSEVLSTDAEGVRRLVMPLSRHLHGCARCKQASGVVVLIPQGRCNRRVRDAA